MQFVCHLGFGGSSSYLCGMRGPKDVRIVIVLCPFAALTFLLCPYTVSSCGREACGKGLEKEMARLLASLKWSATCHEAQKLSTKIRRVGNRMVDVMERWRGI